LKTSDNDLLKRAKNAFVSGTQEAKLRFLTRLGTRLTVSARANAYQETGTDLNVAYRRLHGVNELHHQIYGAIAAELNDHPGYPDESLFDILIRKAERDDFKSELIRGIVKAADVNER